MHFVLVVAYLIIVLAVSSQAVTDTVFCYYASWATYREGPAKFEPEDIDVDVCTHITYTFVGLTDDGQVNILDDWNEVQKRGLSRFAQLRERNPRVKVLISMGGWNEGSERYSRVVRDPTLRYQLVTSLLAFVNKWTFDGVDFDWEYPAQRGGSPDDYTNYISFLAELRQAFGNGLLITAAVGVAPHLIESSYNVAAMNQYLDFINLMTYDYTTADSGHTGFNAPISSIATTVDMWLANGASKDKLLMGLPFYSRTFTLSVQENHQLGAAARGPGTVYGYSKEPGVVMYRDVCAMLDTKLWSFEVDDKEMSALAYNGDQWWSVDTSETIQMKTKWAITMGLRGVMIWTVDSDDHTKYCAQNKSPLLPAVGKAINGAKNQ